MKDGEHWFRSIFKPGTFWIVLGPRGSGKTSFTMRVSSAALTYPDYYIFSNVLLKKLVHTEDGQKFVETYPPRYIKIRSMADVYHELPPILERQGRVILIIDEALLGTGWGAGQTILSADVRAVVAFVSIIRKLGISLVLISQSESLIMSKYRDSNIVTGWFRRRPGLAAGYGIREVIEVLYPNGSTEIWETPPEGLAKPEPVAEEGDIVFDTAAPASFSMGKYRATGKPFDLFRTVDIMSGVISDDVIPVLREHLASPSPDVLEEPEPEERAESASVPAPRREGGIKETVDKMLLSGFRTRQIIDETGGTKQYISERRHALRTEGKL